MASATAAVVFSTSSSLSKDGLSIFIHKPSISCCRGSPLSSSSTNKMFSKYPFTSRPHKRFKPFSPVMEWQDSKVKLEIDVPVSVAYNCYLDREAIPRWMPFISSVKECKYGRMVEANSGFWRKMWNLKIPPKVKNFLWRASSNCLPTKDLLRQRQVQIPAICPTCNEYNETILHSLVLCPFAVSTWSRLNISLLNGDFNSFPEWLQLVFDQQNTEKIHVIVMISWMLWKNRNDLVWNQHSADSAEVIESAISVLNQWRSVQDKTFDRFMGYITQEDGDEHWNPPPFDSVKINTDAAIFQDSDMYSHAFVVRDHNGRLVEAGSKCSRGNLSPDLAEALSIMEALSWLKEKEYANAVLESDCLQVVQAIRSSFVCFSYLGRVVDEFRKLLVSLSSKNVKFKFVKRSAKKVAHYLARYNCSMAVRSWRVGDVHPEFHSVLVNDIRK